MGGGGGKLYRSVDYQWRDHDAEAHSDFGDLRLRRGRAAGVDASVGQPGAGGGELVLYLVLPRGADAGAAFPVVQHRRTLPAHQSVDPLPG
ncbi:hypothetical protein D3C80_1870310 [compost metagenome]